MAATSGKEWLIRWSSPRITIKGQDPVYAAQRPGIHLAIRNDIEKFVSSHQDDLIPLIRLQINHRSLKQTDLTDKQGNVVTTVCQAQSGSRIQ